MSAAPVVVHDASLAYTPPLLPAKHPLDVVTLDECEACKVSTPHQCASSTAYVPIMTTHATMPTAFKTAHHFVGHCVFVILPLSLAVGMVIADSFNLDFVHLVQLRWAVPVDQYTLPSDDALKDHLLRWTFLQSAYLLPMVLLTGAMLVLEFVLLVGRLRASRLVDGLIAALVLLLVVVGVMTLLNAFVRTSVVGVLFTKMVAGLAACSVLGLVAQAVELFAPPFCINASLSDASPINMAAVGFPTVTFAAIYGLGTAFGCCASLAGYQLSGLMQRHEMSLAGVRGYQLLFLVEGAFLLVLCLVIAVLLVLGHRLGRPTWMPHAQCQLTLDQRYDLQPVEAPNHFSKTKATQNDHVSDFTTSSDAILAGSLIRSLGPADRVDTAHGNDQQPAHPTVQADPADPADPTDPIDPVDPTEPADPVDPADKPGTFASLRRLSSYCTSPMTTIPILKRFKTSEAANGTSGVINNLRTLQQMHTGFGLWVSRILRRIMILIFGGMGVDDAAFDLISAGTSSRETFIAGVLIVSNTSVIQAAVLSQIVKIESAASKQVFRSPAALKMVAVLPGLPTLVGGVSGAVSAVAWSVLATQRPPTRGAWRGRVGSWMRAPWWVPALLTSCLVVSIVGLALAVIASIVVPDGTCGSWIIYLSTIITFTGTVPQLPLALLEIYSVLDDELGRTVGHQPTCSQATTSSENCGTGAASSILKSNQQRSVHALRWERVGVMISTLTTTFSSTLLTAWILMLSEAFQMVFLFISVALAVAGSVWLMLRHTLHLRRLRRQSKLAQQTTSALTHT